MRDVIRLAVVAGVFVISLAGWGIAGTIGATVGLATGLALLVVPWRGRQLWSWMDLYVRRNQPIVLTEPVTIVNDRAAGGVRYQGHVAAVAVQLLGRPYRPTYLTGSTAAETENAIDVRTLVPELRQSLGLTVESISVVNAGARRRATGDYPRVYDTLIGTPPYAGQRETWVVIRIRALDNGESLQWRTTVGATALAVAQRVAAGLRRRGFRARVATATDIVEFERRLGRTALEPRNRHWRSARSDTGWQTTYAYRPAEITSEFLAQAWAIPADRVIQNVTVYPDEMVSATITLQTPQPPSAPPVAALQTLPGDQARALAANLCGPRQELRGVGTCRLTRPLIVPIGPSGVLLGRTPRGDRLALPLSDPGEQSRVVIAADDVIAKRIIIRAAAAGDRISVHTADLDRWQSVRMPNIAVIEHPRPASGTTISVTDGTVQPAPRPSTVIAVGRQGGAASPAPEVAITQTGPGTVEIIAAGSRHEAHVDFFRAENRYVSAQSAGSSNRDVRADQAGFRDSDRTSAEPELEMAD